MQVAVQHCIDWVPFGQAHSPCIAHGAGPGIGLRAPGELAIELGKNRETAGKAKLRPAEVSAEFFAGVAPWTMKLAPGSTWKAAASVGSLTVSCAQASLPRRARTAP